MKTNVKNLKVSIEFTQDEIDEILQKVMDKQIPRFAAKYGCSVETVQALWEYAYLTQKLSGLTYGYYKFNDVRAMEK